MGFEQRFNQQIEINFPSLEDEKIAIANKHGLSSAPENLALIEKQGHKFLYKGTPIEDYARMMKETYSKDTEHWKN
ncbi:MAG TPA: hypothetical protein VGE18_02535 [Candidatus Paceibacterota bacterium]